MGAEDVTILIGDNSVLARKQLKDAIVPFGISRILDAADGQEAVELYKEHVPDIVFLSLLMPEKDGATTISEIMEINPNADIIVVSSMGTQSQIKQTFQLGAKEFIQKPFHSQQITDILRSRLEGSV